MAVEGSIRRTAHDCNRPGLLLPKLARESCDRHAGVDSVGESLDFARAADPDNVVVMSSRVVSEATSTLMSGVPSRAVRCEPEAQGDYAR